jgi:UV DNA damage endonuclease
MIKRIGFACKLIDGPSQIDGIKQTDNCKQYNTSTTTVAWLNRQSRAVAEEKLWDLMKHNIEACRLLVEKVATFDENLRMVRLSSDILPVYTQQDWCWFWRLLDVRAYCEREFRRVGDLARQNNVRLSFHPGQFTVLASESDNIVERSIEEFEYHADMVRWMGFGQTFQDFKVNVHISGRRGPDGIRAVLPRLSTEARNCITIENEEITHNLNTCLELADVVPIVLDIHHHWINSGEYIDPNDQRVQRVIDSWRGVRPVCHYSVSREDVLVGHSTIQRPDLQTLLDAGYKKGKLRAHSNFYWNKEVNDWAIQFNEQFDIMCESKAKNLASFAFADCLK